METKGCDKMATSVISNGVLTGNTMETENKMANENRMATSVSSNDVLTGNTMETENKMVNENKMTTSAISNVVLTGNTMETKNKKFFNVASNCVMPRIGEEENKEDLKKDENETFEDAQEGNMCENQSDALSDDEVILQKLLWRMPPEKIAKAIMEVQKARFQFQEVEAGKMLDATTQTHKRKNHKMNVNVDVNVNPVVSEASEARTAQGPAGPIFIGGIPNTLEDKGLQAILPKGAHFERFSRGKVGFGKVVVPGGVILKHDLMVGECKLRVAEWLVRASNFRRGMKAPGLNLGSLKEMQARRASASLVVKSLELNVDAYALRHHFPEAINSEILYKAGRSSGLGFVDFRNEIAATKAMGESQGKKINGRPILLAYSLRSGRHQEPHVGGDGRGGKATSESHTQGDVRKGKVTPQSHTQGDGRGGKVTPESGNGRGGNVTSESHTQDDVRKSKVTPESHTQGDGRGGKVTSESGNGRGESHTQGEYAT